MKKFTYNNVYQWNVIDELINGKKVCVCDKKYQSCDTLNELSVAEALEIIKKAKENDGRYVFWVEQEAEEVKE